MKTALNITLVRRVKEVSSCKFLRRRVSDIATNGAESLPYFVSLRIYVTLRFDSVKVVLSMTVN